MALQLKYLDGSIDYESKSGLLSYYQYGNFGFSYSIVRNTEALIVKQRNQ